MFMHNTRPFWNAALLLVGVSLCVILASGQLFSMPAKTLNPENLVQPDGHTTLQVYLIGDERVGRLVTEDGYTVVKDTDGWYCYATLDGSGDLVSSGRRVTARDERMPADDDFLRITGKGVVPTTRSTVYQQIPDTPEPVDESVYRREPQTTNNVLVILIDFSDQVQTYPANDFVNLMMQNSFDGFGCVNQYYLENSYGAFGINATVVGPYRAAKLHAYYAYDKNNDTYKDADADVRAAGLVKEAVEAAKAAGVNFAPFDNNGDNRVDGLFVVHAGPGAEISDGTLPAYRVGYPWSHKWNLSSAGVGTVSASGKIISSYTLEPEKFTSSTRSRIGVFCHEYAHDAFALPDLYDYDRVGVGDGPSIGVGDWCLMSDGGYNGPAGGMAKCPSHLSAWCKAKTQWLTPVNVNPDLLNWTVNEVETTPTCYRLWTAGAASTEYFLVEYRRQMLFDTYLPGCGIAIWHIDDLQPTNNVNNHRKVDLEEADGNETPTAQAGDIWLNKTFNNSSTPNSKSYASANTQVGVVVHSTTCPPLGSGANADLLVGSPASPVEIMIRDCYSDIGNEPDNNCGVYWESPDVYVDNNFDNIQDWSGPGNVNKIYFVARNIGTTQATGATLNAYFVNPSLGCNFPGGTAIADNLTGATTFSYKSIPPSGNSRVFINWLVPSPPPTINHYCVGGVLNVTGDMQFATDARSDNNVCQINVYAFAQRVGQVTPLSGRLNKSYAPEMQQTVFHSQLRVCNPLGGAALLDVDFDSLTYANTPPNWTPHIPTMGPWVLLPDSCTVIDLYVYVDEPQHNDSVTIGLELYPVDNPMVTLGGVRTGYVIDDVEASSIGNLTASSLACPDDYLDPCPRVRLTWSRPAVDLLGYAEGIRWHYIYRGTHPGLDSMDLYDSLALDADSALSGFQYYDFRALPADTTVYYAVATVDRAFSLSALSNEAALRYSCCEASVGNVNCDLSDGVDIGDLTTLIDNLFVSFTPLCCPAEANCDGSGGIDIGDLTALIDNLFITFSPLPACE